MALFLDETKLLTMYRGKFKYPIDPKDRMHNSMVILMTPNVQASINVMNMKNALNNGMNFKSYFLERNVEFIINGTLDKDNHVSINEESVPYSNDIDEGLDISSTITNISPRAFFYPPEDGTLIREYSQEFIEDLIMNDLGVLTEDTLTTKYGKFNLSQIFRKMLYYGRLKSQAEVLKYYEEIKKKVPDIQFTFSNPALYKGKNLYYDWAFYTEKYFKSKTLKGDRGLDIFNAFVGRFLSDNRFNTYHKRTIIIPYQEWIKNSKINPFDHTNEANPFNLLYRSLRLGIDRFKNWNDSLIVITANDVFFTMRLNYFNREHDLPKYTNLINRMRSEDYSNAEQITRDSKLVIMNHLANTLSQGGITIHNLTPTTSEESEEELKDRGALDTPDKKNVDEKKAALISKLEKVADRNVSVDDALKDLDTNDDPEKTAWMQDILMDLQSEEGVRMNKARSERHDKMQQELLKKSVRGKSVLELMNQFKKNYDLEETSVPIDTIDDHWHHMKFASFNSAYTKDDMMADIMAVFEHFTHTTHPMNILNIDVKNTSTSEDYVDTWTVSYEDAESGKRSNVKVDIPRMIGDRFMKLRGNEKVLIGQLMLLPIVKTDFDTVQIVSNYNKIFVRRKSPSGNGKSSPIINRMCKIFNKYEGKEFSAIPGDNSKVCKMYTLPISYVDLASMYSQIKFADGSYISFNMDNLKDIPFDMSTVPSESKKLKQETLNDKYLAIYVNSKGKKEAIPDGVAVDQYILNKMTEHSKEFVDLYNVTPSSKLMYSEASILNSKIPVIVVAAYSIGLQRVMDRIGVKYEFSEKRPKKGETYFKFSDGYLVYYTNSESDNMVMNGLMQVDTEDFSIKDINSKSMWLDVLDEFGGRVKADGLDNFVDLMMDPITVEICKTLNIPSDYIDALLYASTLLMDNGYNRHSDITGNRLRINEVIVGHLYSVLAKEYGAYRNQIKRSNNKQAGSFTCKQSAVIDSILTHDQTSSDLSTLNPLLEAEAASKVTFKGLSGMNSDRAFSMEKRTYDDSMLGVLSLSTGFASSVGINRQTTIDAGIINKRGFIAPADPKKLDNLRTFSIMEAMSPLAVNRDDPMRTAMAFTQTVQHQMMVRRSMPNLITTGADEALPYLTSQKFAYKFKGRKGTIKDVTSEYIIVQDDDTKECDYIDLRETIQKNSDGGFYITTKLDANSNIKKGMKVKFNDILAYDKSCYSPSIGNSNEADPNSISYNIGTMAKIAILNTAMGFEDSCVVDHTLSKALAFDLVVQKEVNLNKFSVVYDMVKVGQPILEGEPLIVFSDSFEDDDANAILKSLNQDSKIISDIGRKKVHAKVTGTVQDIKIFRTVEDSELSPTLRKIVSEYDRGINKYKRVMRSNNIDKEYTLEPTSPLPMQGKLKNVEGVRIEFYIKTVDMFSSGDKLVFMNGLKGVTSSLIPNGQEAYTDQNPQEHVNGFLTSTGVFGRMVTSCFSIGLLNKAMVELTRQCQEELGIEWRPLQEILLEGCEGLEDTK